MKNKITKLFKPNVPMNIKNMSWPQAKTRFPHLKPYGDADKDGVKNFRDCKPFDMNKKGEEHKMTKDNYEFKFVYKKGKKKIPTAEELVNELK